MKNITTKKRAFIYHKLDADLNYVLERLKILFKNRIVEDYYISSDIDEDHNNIIIAYIKLNKAISIHSTIFYNIDNIIPYDMPIKSEHIFFSRINMRSEYIISDNLYFKYKHILNRLNVQNIKEYIKSYHK